MRQARLISAETLSRVHDEENWELKGGLACAAHRVPARVDCLEYREEMFLEARRLAVDPALALPHTDMVVASACNSHRATIKHLPEAHMGVPQDGTAGLSLAFLRAGASRSIATLWAIHDWAAMHLIKLFYQNLHAGGQQAPFPPLHVAKCLRAATLDLWTEQKWTREDHVYWAAFVVYGLP